MHPGSRATLDLTEANGTYKHRRFLFRPSLLLIISLPHFNASFVFF
jgi:hypothetical protein